MCVYVLFRFLSEQAKRYSCAVSSTAQRELSSFL